MGIRFRYQKIPFGTFGELVARPFVPVYLYRDEQRSSAAFLALLDSGCDLSMFPADIAMSVGIANFESGRVVPSIGFSSQVARVYYHPLAIQIAGDKRVLPLDVGFSPMIPAPFLGRSFFRHFKLVMFREPEEEVELVIPG